jgi:hypothetical protein
MGTKLDELVASEGYGSLQELLEAVISDSVSPGICVNLGCDYTAEVEPDQDRGYCEECRTQTVKSALILAGII